MATSSSGGAETCSICLNKFNLPKFLPCFHTFCCECLQEVVYKHSKNGRFFCPTCRYEVTIPEGGVAKFQTNFYVKAQAADKDAVCEVCEKIASHYCHECEFLLCEACVKNHKSIPVTKSHTLIQLGDISDGTRRVVRDSYCTKHSSEKLRFYCKPCDKVICLHCKLTAHEGHKTEDICDVVNSCRESLVETKIQFEKYLPGIKESLETITADRAKALSTIDTVSAEINSFSNQLVKRINTIRLKALERLNDVKQKIEKKNTESQEMIQSREEFVNSQIQHITDLLRDGLDCDVMAADKDMKQRLTEIKPKDISASRCGIPRCVSSSPDYLGAITCDVADFVNILLTRVTNFDVQPDVLRRFHCGNSTVRSISFSELNKALIVGENYSESIGYFGYFLYHCTSEGIQDQINIPEQNFEIDENDDILILLENCINPDSFNTIWQSKSEIVQYSEEEEDVSSQTKDVDNECTHGPFGNLKKQYPRYDCSAEGDECWINVDDLTVLVTLNNGIFKTLSYNPFATAGDPFLPMDVCWGTHRDIYIADAGSGSVLVYSVEEGFQKTLSIPQHGVPSAVAMDTDEHLWIGHQDGEICVCNVY